MFFFVFLLFFSFLFPSLHCLCPGRDQGLTSLGFPMAHTSTALMSVKSRALLSIDDASDHLPRPPSFSHASLRRSNTKTEPAVSGGNALILGEQMVGKIRKLGELVGGVEEGGHEEESSVRHVCSCPLETGRNGSMRHNQTSIQM